MKTIKTNNLDLIKSSSTNDTYTIYFIHTSKKMLKTLQEHFEECGYWQEFMDSECNVTISILCRVNNENCSNFEEMFEIFKEKHLIKEN